MRPLESAESALKDALSSASKRNAAIARKLDAWLAIMDRVGAGVVLASPSGRLVRANSLGQKRLRQAGFASRAAGSECPRSLLRNAGFHLISNGQESPRNGSDIWLYCQTAAQPGPACAAEPFTARESEVFDWLSQGKTYGEIGIILGASSRTIEKHGERIRRKLGAPLKEVLWRRPEAHPNSPPTDLRRT